MLNVMKGKWRQIIFNFFNPPLPLWNLTIIAFYSHSLAGTMGRKRPLLGVPRSGMNPTKRTVMTLLARAKHSQSLHPNRNGSTGFAE